MLCASVQSAVHPLTRNEKGAPSTTRAAHERQLPRRQSLPGKKPARSTAVSSGSCSLTLSVVGPTSGRCTVTSHVRSVARTIESAATGRRCSI